MFSGIWMALRWMLLLCEMSITDCLWYGSNLLCMTICDINGQQHIVASLWYELYYYWLYKWSPTECCFYGIKLFQILCELSGHPLRVASLLYECCYHWVYGIWVVTNRWWIYLWWVATHWVLLLCDMIAISLNICEMSGGKLFILICCNNGHQLSVAFLQYKWQPNISDYLCEVSAPPKRFRLSLI